MTAASKRKGGTSWAYMLMATLLLIIAIYTDGAVSGWLFVLAFMGYSIGVVEALSGR